MIRLSFTSLNLSMSYLPLRFVGLDNFSDILGDEDVWISNAPRNNVTRIDPATNRVVETIAVGADPCSGLAACWS